VSDWEFFRMTGSQHSVQQALERLREQGWQVLDAPEAGPLETWVVRVTRDAGVLS
jgi:hypothetical protein